jgi:hypothetical protein
VLAGYTAVNCSDECTIIATSQIHTRSGIS